MNLDFIGLTNKKRTKKEDRNFLEVKSKNVFKYRFYPGKLLAKLNKNSATNKKSGVLPGIYFYSQGYYCPQMAVFMMVFILICRVIAV